MIDVKYIGIDRNTINPRTDQNNVDVNASYKLAMTFQKYGLGIDTRSPTYGVITEDGTGTRSIFPYFSTVPGHKDHIHLQGAVIRYSIPK